VLGADPRVQGLHWFGGLGGRGMAVAPAAGELLAAVVRGEPHAMPQLAPSRMNTNASAVMACLLSA